MQSTALDEQRTCYINSHQCYSVTAPGEVEGLRPSENQPAASHAMDLATGREVLKNIDVEGALISRFQPRGKEPVRNCTALPQDFVDSVVLKVANLLLSGIQDSSGTSDAWSQGGKSLLSVHNKQCAMNKNYILAIPKRLAFLRLCTKMISKSVLNKCPEVLTV